MKEEKTSQNATEECPLIFDYDDEDEFVKFLQSLPKGGDEKVIAMIRKIQVIGLMKAMEYEFVKKLDKNLYEIRVNTSGIFSRSLFFQLKDDKPQMTCIITSSFKKKSNKTPRKEIAKAIKRRERYLSFHFKK